MERERLARWLYAFGVGFLLYSATLCLFIFYRFTEEAFIAAVLCTIIGIILCVCGFVLNRARS